MDMQSETQQSTTNYYAKKGPLTVSDDQLTIRGLEMGKCRVFIPSHSHQVIPIPIPMKLA